MAKRSRLLRIGLIGAEGRLGRTIAELARTELANRVELTVSIERDGPRAIEEIATKVDVFLDVSSPAAASGYLTRLARSKSKVAYVAGCTGWTERQLKTLKTYSKRATTILAPNFSPGVNLMLDLLERAAPILKIWGYDTVVHETHHTRKLDSPSGTAKAIVAALGDLKPQVHSSRAGNIVGTHTVSFVGPGDVLCVEHEALDRTIFARGAILAAEWASRPRRPGQYSMRDVIGSN